MRKVCQILLDNDLVEWWQLCRAPDPCRWPKAGELEAEEIKFLREVAAKCQEKPRCDWLSFSVRVRASWGDRSPSPKRSRNIAGEVKRGFWAGLRSNMPKNTAAAASGPMLALTKANFGYMSEAQRLAWAEKARLDALLGGMRLSLPSLRSGLRCYVAFVGDPAKGPQHVCIAVVWCVACQIDVSPAQRHIFHRRCPRCWPGRYYSGRGVRGRTT